MDDGWQSKRSRVPGHSDHVIIRLGAKGHILKAVIDTSHFCGNYPNKVALKAIASNKEVPEESDDQWTTLIAPVSVGPHDLFYFDLPQTEKAFTHAKIILIPDGGIKRLRLYGVREGAAIPALPIDIGSAAAQP